MTTIDTASKMAKEAMKDVIKDFYKNNNIELMMNGKSESTLCERRVLTALMFQNKEQYDINIKEYKNVVTDMMDDFENDDTKIAIFQYNDKEVLTSDKPTENIRRIGNLCQRRYDHYKIFAKFVFEDLSANDTVRYFLEFEKIRQRKIV